MSPSRLFFWPWPLSLLFLTAFSLALTLTWPVAKNVWQMFAYSKHLPLKEIEFTIQEKAEKFVCMAFYTYEVDGKVYRNKELLTPLTFESKKAAEKSLQHTANKKWGVWIHPKIPKASTLQKNIEKRPFFHMCLGWGVVIYFLWLFEYIQSFFSKETKA